MKRWSIYGNLLLMLLVACGDNRQNEPETQGVDCGPHQTLYGGFDGTAYCDCADNYIAQGDECVPAPANELGTNRANEGDNLLESTCFAGPSPCDPRTGEGCAATEACDFSDNEQLTCFAPPHDAQIGQPCNNQFGPFCAPGSWCFLSRRGPPQSVGPFVALMKSALKQEPNAPAFLPIPTSEHWVSVVFL